MSFSPKVIKYEVTGPTSEMDGWESSSDCHLVIIRNQDCHFTKTSFFSHVNNLLGRRFLNSAETHQSPILNLIRKITQIAENLENTTN